MSLLSNEMTENTLIETKIVVMALEELDVVLFLLQIFLSWIERCDVAGMGYCRSGKAIFYTVLDCFYLFVIQTLPYIKYEETEPLYPRYRLVNRIVR